MAELPVHRIEMPTPYGVGPVNAYLIQASPLTLIDAGINTDEARQALLSGLRVAGCAPEDVERVLVTHGHPDHYGLAHLLHEAGAEVYFPVRERQRVGDRNLRFEIGRLLLTMGMPMELLMEMEQGMRNAPRPPRLGDEFLPVDAGDRFELKNDDGETFELETHFSPGHTGGHLIYFEPDGRILFAGDQLLPGTSPNPLLEPSLDAPGERRRSLEEYLSSLEAMSRLQPSLAYPGHGEVVTDPEPLIRRTIDHHHARRDELAARLDEAGKTPYELSLESFSDLRGADVFLAVSEVVAHLDLLVTQRSAEVEERCGIAYYRRSR